MFTMEALIQLQQCLIDRSIRESAFGKCQIALYGKANSGTPCVSSPIRIFCLGLDVAYEVQVVFQPVFPKLSEKAGIDHTRWVGEWFEVEPSRHNLIVRVQGSHGSCVDT